MNLNHRIETPKMKNTMPVDNKNNPFWLIKLRRLELYLYNFVHQEEQVSVFPEEPEEIG